MSKRTVLGYALAIPGGLAWLAALSVMGWYAFFDIRTIPHSFYLGGIAFVVGAILLTMEDCK